MKRTLIVLVAALALLAGLLWLKGNNRQIELKDVFALDSTKIGEVKSLQVTKKPDTTMLVFKDGKWVTAGEDFPADTAKTAKVLRYLFSLQSKEIASRNPLHPEEYGLDTTEAKHVVLRGADGKSMAEVVIGKTSGADYNSTYWKWEGKPEVYRTPGNFTWEISPRANDWKERKLFHVEAKDVKTIEVTWKDSTDAVFHYKLDAVNDSTWKLLDPQDSGKVSKQAVADMPVRLADMVIDDFVAANDTNISKARADDARIWIKVALKDGHSHELKVGKTLDGNAYVQHPSRKDLVKMGPWRFDAFKKKPAELMEGYVPPAPQAPKAGKKARA